MYNFYNSSGNNTFNVQTPSITNPDNAGLKLSFDFAACVRYTMPVALPQDFALDYIYLEYSKDNGTTWQLLDTFRIGTDGPLNTYGGTGISPNAIFNPSSTQWTTIDNIKLPRGTNKVAFRGIKTNTVAGNMAYLDNVSIDTCYTPMPLGDTIQFDAAYTTVADLIVNGSQLHWYSDANGNVSIDDTTTLVDSNYYYVSQTIDGCESAPLAILYADTATVDTPPVDTSNSIRAMELFKNVKIFPNPSSDIVEIASDIKIQEILISDIVGHTIKEIWC